MIQVDGPEPRFFVKRREIVRVKWTDLRTFISLSERPKSFATHYRGNRSEECTLEKGLCQGCGDGLEQKVRVYVMVVSPPQHEAVFLDLSPMAWNSLKVAFLDRASLRGCMFKIGKTKGGMNGRFVVEALERRINPNELPTEETPDEVLRFLWNHKRGS